VWGAHERCSLEAMKEIFAPAGFVLLVGPEREDEVKKAIVDGLAAFRLPDGSYQLENEYRYLIARA
jgi:hypothetical protein